MTNGITQKTYEEHLNNPPAPAPQRPIATYLIAPESTLKHAKKCFLDANIAFCSSKNRTPYEEYKELRRAIFLFNRLLHIQYGTTKKSREKAAQNNPQRSKRSRT